MKIALIIERFDPSAGGAEKSTAQIAHHLARKGHQVSIITWWQSNTTMPGVQIVSRTERRRFGVLELLLFRGWALQQVADGDFDTSLSLTTTVPATVVQPRGGTLQETMLRNLALRKSILSRGAKRVLMNLAPKNRVHLQLEHRTLADPMVKRIAALSQYVVCQLQRHYRIGLDRIVLIPNASEMPKIADSQRRQWRRIVREGFCIRDDRTVFLFAAWNERLKGVHTLLAAVKRLKQHGLVFSVLIVGAMPYRLQRLAAKLGVRDEIKFVGGTCCMPALFCAADVTVHPTYYDPSSKVVIESLLMGVPAISTVFNGASEWIRPDSRRDHGPGQLPPPGSDADLGRGRVLDDPSDSVALAEAMAALAVPAEREKCRGFSDLSEALSMSHHVESLERLLMDNTSAVPTRSSTADLPDRAQIV